MSPSTGQLMLKTSLCSYGLKQEYKNGVFVRVFGVDTGMTGMMVQRSKRAVDVNLM